MKKAKRFISVILTCIMSLMVYSGTALSVSAADVDSGISSVGGYVELSQITNDLYSSDGALACNIAEVNYVSETPDENASYFVNEVYSGSVGDSDGINSYSSPNPLSEVTVMKVFLGNIGEEAIDITTWDTLEGFNQTSTTATINVDTTKYTYICFRVFQWGYSTGEYSRLDGKTYNYIRSVADYNSRRQPVQTGDILYGWENDYIFKIPEGKTTSVAKFWRYSDLVTPPVTKQVIININWTSST